MLFPEQGNDRHWKEGFVQKGKINKVCGYCCADLFMFFDLKDKHGEKNRVVHPVIFR